MVYERLALYDPGNHYKVHMGCRYSLIRVRVDDQCLLEECQLMRIVVNPSWGKGRKPAGELGLEQEA